METIMLSGGQLVSPGAVTEGLTSTETNTANTETWTVTDGTTVIPAQVPGNVLADLHRAGLLPDLWWRDNELAWQEPCLRTWTFSRTVSLNADHLAQQHLELVFAGLDTLATVRLNGHIVLQADNMHHEWRCDIRDQAVIGENLLTIEFASAVTAAAERQAERELICWNDRNISPVGRGWMRKMACSFGWDWGPCTPGCGIWRPVTIEAWSEPRLTDCHITQFHQEHAVQLTVAVQLSQPSQVCQALADANCLPSHKQNYELTVIDPQGDEQTWSFAELSSAKSSGKSSSAIFPDGDGFTGTITIDQPQLWWPNGMGDQPLYTILVRDTKTAQVLSHRIGLRTIELNVDPDEDGQAFQFIINGEPVFAFGANWIPIDMVEPIRSRDEYQARIQDAVDANMNMIRVWGGGIIESDDFYDCCDEQGILIWQDFLYACATYPLHDQTFIASITYEAQCQVKALRHHACLALWCGNNELEQGLVADQRGPRHMSWDEYRPVFDDMLSNMVQTFDGSTPYWPGSPHTPEMSQPSQTERKDFNSPLAGDAHCWSVWFGGGTLESQRAWNHRFMSEFGFQSFPEPRTIETFTQPEDRNFTSRIMDYHQRSPDGNNKIFRYMLDWFRCPESYEEQMWSSQLIQALTVQYAAEHGRRIQDRMRGILYWQLNDCWPAATWSSVDVFGRWKALQYFARRFFAPLLVSGVEDTAHNTVAIHASNNGPATEHVIVAAEVMTTTGEVIHQQQWSKAIPHQTNALIDQLDLTPHLEQYPAHQLIVWLDMWHDQTDKNSQENSVPKKGAGINDRPVSRNMVTLVKPKHLSFTSQKLPANSSVTINTVSKSKSPVTSQRSGYASKQTKISTSQIILSTSNHINQYTFAHAQPCLSPKISTGLRAVSMR